MLRHMSGTLMKSILRVLVRCGWMYKPGTVWLGVQTWYSVVGCTDLVQCGWMYRPGTVWLDVQFWYSVVGCISPGYSVVGYDVMMNQFLSNPN